MRARLLPLLLLTTLQAGEQPFYDQTHESKVFGETRHYRIFLPSGYATSGRHYPVLYYFHGSSDRYTLEKYDDGLDTVPKIAAFVAAHDLIVVAADGYIAKDYSGFYGGRPYDVDREGGDLDYGQYFLELVRHIDATYRTLTSRRYRATSGLSMGGFLSLYLSARYPEVIGSASAFNPGPEFYTGEKGHRSLWRPKDHVLNHEKTMIRLIRASGDYISQYHEETRGAYAITPSVNFEYRQDDYHRHWATSIAETFEFHLRAFASPSLDTVPVEWNYDSSFSNFHVWNYSVEAQVKGPALFYLEHVTQGGLRIRTRRWAPDGPPVACESLQLTTAPLYQAGAAYHVFDYDLAESKTKRFDVQAGREGRLRISLNCHGHELGFAGPGTGAQAPVVLPVTNSDVLRLLPDQLLALPVRLFNPRGQAFSNVRVELSSDYPTVQVIRGKAECGQIAAGEVKNPGSGLQVRFVAGEGEFAHARLQLKVVFDGTQEAKQSIDVLVAPSPLPPAPEIVILDGRTKTLSVFQQKGNQGGGTSVERTVTEGTGNGNGVLEPGESVTIWVKISQGLDPFDKNNWHRAKVYTDSRWLTEAADLQEAKGSEWTGAQNRSSLLALSSETPPKTEIPVILDCESWSFHYTPDVRYGNELLYQAFQIHKHRLFAWKWTGRS